MALTVRLNPETQHCLDELEADTGQDKSATAAMRRILVDSGVLLS